MLKAIADGAVELYYDNGKKFVTTASGTQYPTAGIQVSHVGDSGTFWTYGTTDGSDSPSGAGTRMQYHYYSGSAWDKVAYITENGYGVPDGKKLQAGNNDDLQIYHDGTLNVIDAASGNLEIRHGAEKMIACANDGQVELYHDNTKKFETTSGGANIHGALSTTGHISPTANNTYDLGDSTYRWRNLYINDLQLSNEGSSNSVDGTWGDWTLQEGENDIFMLNNRTGKKYKMALTEVS